VGNEWPYIPSKAYDHAQVISNIIARIKSDSPDVGVIVTDTHNDQDYTDSEHPASRNLALILAAIESSCADAGLRPVGATLDSLCDPH